MNRVLFKAAAIVNIAAAALIYVACSGDDGKDGKDGAPGTGCIVQDNTVAGGYDIVCGGVVYGNIKDGIQGPPGTASTGACTGTPVPTGISITCNGEFVGIVTNGEPGPQGPAGPGGGVGPGSDCAVTAVDVPPPPAGGQLYGDKAINIRCATDNRSATILVCPAVPATSPNGSTGLLFNTDGQLGRCTVQGLIVRSEQAVLQCGGDMFDPKKQFCQRTFATRNSTGAAANDSGFFVTYNKSTGVLSAAAYPANNYNNIVDPESNYNLAGNQPNVKSVVLPLCGVEPTNSSNQTTIAALHIGGSGGANTIGGSSLTVYNALQYCGRNLVFKVGDATSGNVSATLANGKPVPGGSLDNNASNPFSAAWSVQASGQCYLGLKETNVNGNYGYGINGFTFTGTNTPANASSSCSFFGATTLGTPPYTSCPELTPLVALDDVGCIARSSCLYHSTIDNTCLVGKQTGSLFGKTVYDSAYITAKTGTSPNFVYTAAFTNPNDATAATRGIFRTPLGSRDGRGQSPSATLSRDGNMWSTPCKTTNVARLGYYAVNDPYLTNKKWKDNWAVDGYPDEDDFIPPPICGGPNLEDSVITAIPFDDAFACVAGELSVYYPATAQTNDGNAWDRPIYCVRVADFNGIDLSGQACYLSGVTEDDCTIGGGISALFVGSTAFTIAGTLTPTWSDTESACKVVAAEITSTTCGTITRATVPETTPIVATTYNSTQPEYAAINATTSGLTGEWRTAGGGRCKVSTTGTNVFTSANCGNVTRIRQPGSGEVPATGSWIPDEAGDGSVPAYCSVALASNASLASVCNSIEVVRSSNVSGSSTPADVTAEWK